jgi:hypothetical protein
MIYFEHCFRCVERLHKDTNCLMMCWESELRPTFTRLVGLFCSSSAQGGGCIEVSVLVSAASVPSPYQAHGYGEIYKTNWK